MMQLNYLNALADQLTVLDTENLIEAIDQQLDEERRKLASSHAAEAFTDITGPQHEENGSSKHDLEGVHEEEEVERETTTTKSSTTTTFYPVQQDQLTHSQEGGHHLANQKLHSEEEDRLANQKLLSVLFNRTVLKEQIELPLYIYFQNKFKQIVQNDIIATVLWRQT
jgi:hypothetical protein